MPRRKQATWRKYTPAEIRFIKGRIAGRSYAEMAELFNRSLGLQVTVEQMKSTIARYLLSNGRDCRFRPGQIPHNKGIKGCPAACEKTWFKRGNRPQNWQPVGTEIVDSYGYVRVKTRNPRTWKFKHRLIWEKAHGKIPRGHVVLFADGDKLNFALNNLLLVSRRELAVMNNQGLICNHRDLTLAGKAIADIKMLTTDRKQEIKTGKKSRTKRRNNHAREN